MTNSKELSDDPPHLSSVIAFVVIGRNEGERLKNSLRSIQAAAPLSEIVYVDSGSTDGSIEFAESNGIHTVTLDLSVPFTAARARNEGIRYIHDKFANTEYIQFIDGDCKLDTDWLPKADQFLSDNSDVAIVAGRRVEIRPDDSIYNRLCDIEWNTPVGEALACGGDALIRVSALNACGGYRNDVIAGEEPEMCVRLRALNWRIFRLDANMTYHDANMTKFSQWWKRTKRCGFAYALGASIHGASPEKHWVAETRKAILWGALIPVATLIGCLLSHSIWPFAALIVLYVIQIFRLSKHVSAEENFNYTWAFFILLAKFPEMFGVMEFYKKRLKNETMEIIEYK